MSYILDALKKSDQERQQGNLPHLHSAHGPLLQGRGSSSLLKQHYILWLISGGALLLLISLGILFFQYRQVIAERDVVKTTEATVPTTEETVPSAEPQTSMTPDQTQPSRRIAAGNESSSPQVTVQDQNEELVSIAAQTDIPEPLAGIDTGAPPSLPLLNDLPAAVQAEIPDLKYAGHTYSQNSNQRMIIINGKILREGNMIAPNIYLREITWEGLIIESNGTLFRVQTN
jgi:general secretion pathway protein B